MREIDTIILHCTATPAGREVTIEEVDRWHRERGFRCVGYHFLVLLDGSVQTGRQLSEVGAHCRNHNLRSVGIAYVGGLTTDGKPADTRTKEQRKVLRALVEYVQDIVYRQQGTIPRVVTHHMLDHSKACPCFTLEEL